MRHSTKRIAVLLAVMGAMACDGKSKETQTSKVTMRLDAAADLTADFFAQPYPFEGRRLADGRYDLRGFPNPASYEIIEFFKSEIGNDLKGAGTNSAVFMAFTGGLDFSQAVTAPAEGVKGQAAVLLVNVDAKSREYGRFMPVFSRFYAGDNRYLPVNTLAVTPVPGFPLRGDTLYAVVLYNDFGLRAKSGTLAQSPALAAALAGAGDFADTYAPLRDALPKLNLDAGRIVGATVFRTVDFAADLFKARDWLIAQGVTGSAVVTEMAATPYRHVHGTFQSIQFQHGDPKEVGGGFELDEKGVPTPASTATLRFALMLPEGTPPPGGWPVVIYAHGTGGDYHSAIPLSGAIDDGWSTTSGYAVKDEGYNLAKKGIALISYDQPYHGTRNARVPDCTDTCPQLYTFNFLNPKAARDGFRQSALDAVQLTQAVLHLQFNWSGVDHKFDPAKLYYMGHSQGSTSGPMFVAAEPTVKAAVFSGPAGGLALTFLLKTEPIDIPSVAGFIFGDLEGFDLFQPVINLFQAYLEPVDPMNYAHLVAEAPRDEGIVRHVLATEGLQDAYTPPMQAEAFAIALGVPPMTPVYQDLIGFDMAGLDPVAPGFTNNLTNVYGDKWTGALIQFPDTGHFSIYCQTAANQSYPAFLASVAAGTPRIDDYGDRSWQDDGATDVLCDEDSATAAPRVGK